jgi:energy-coupling factor transporter ATP-binding protein EcfA2
MDQARAMLLRKLHVEGFGCVRDATVELEPLTVLVGPNDSGKSMLLRALTTLAEASRREKGWRDVFPDAQSLTAQTFNGRGNAIKLGVAGQLGTEAFAYDVEVSAARGDPALDTERLEAGPHIIERAGGKLSFHEPNGIQHQFEGPDEARPMLHARSIVQWHGPQAPDLLVFSKAATSLLQAVSAVRLYSLRPESLRRATSPLNELSSGGLGLSNAIADLLLRGRDVMERIEGALSVAMPHVKRIDIKAQGGPDEVRYRIELVTRSGARIPSHMISDGVLLFLGYLYLVLGPDPASVLLIEEPETGIHFGLLRGVMELLRSMTTGTHGGPPTQVILTTHSPLLLNLVEPEEIRIVQRGADGATSVRRFADAPDLGKLLDYQGPGEIWVNQGEEYLTRPGAPAS